MLKIEKKIDSGIFLLKLNGQITSETAAAFDEELKSAPEGIQNITLDMSNLTFISSSGLRAILGAQKRLDAVNGHIYIKNVRPDIMDVFEMVNFTRFLLIK